jgi:hypothetical protein
MPGPFTAGDIEARVAECGSTVDLRLTNILDDLTDAYQRLLLIDQCIIGPRPSNECEPDPVLDSITDKLNALSYQSHRLKEAVALVHSYLI